MHKNRGFTLIELIIVVVIIGILSAGAAAKYVSMSRDANIASLHAIKGALSSTSLLVELKARLEEVTEGDIEVNGHSVNISNRYIAGVWNNAWRHSLDIGKDISFTEVSAICIENAICAVGNQSDHASLPDGIITSGQNLLMLWLEGDMLNDECFAYYYNPGVSNSIDVTDRTPKIGIVSDGC